MSTPSPSAANRRKRAARFLEIAARAGVSVATVDRVLNERDSVSAKTRQKVLDAARDLGVRRLLPEPGHALLHLDILLPRNETPFFRRLSAALRDGAAMLDRRVIVHRRTLAEGDVAAMAAAIHSPPHRRAGVIFAARDLPQIRLAVQAALDRGEACVAVASDLPDLPGLTYCGMDNRRAGRVAGHLMGRMCHRPGRVVVLGNAALYHAHRERFEGFAEAVAAFPRLSVALIEAEAHDDPERCHHALRRAMAQADRPVVGIYNTGAGSEGILRALPPPGADRPIWIGHEVSEDHVAYLRADRLDIAIDQDPDGQAIAALQSVLRAAGVMTSAAVPARVEFRIHTRHSLG
jgi:LacI family transcriptional regulator